MYLKKDMASELKNTQYLIAEEINENCNINVLKCAVSYAYDLLYCMSSINMSSSQICLVCLVARTILDV